MSGTETFSAADSFVGYIYQCEYALFRALDPDDPAEALMVETYDDVVVEGKHDAMELLQLKHHDPTRAKAFTDRSEDLWKTIRIWSTLIRDSAIDPSKTSFFLLTTSNASSSAKLVDYLSPKMITGGSRNTNSATSLLTQIAKEIEVGTNASMRKNVEPFLALSDAARGILIGNITIVPGAPVIESLRQKIVRRLSLTGATTDNLENLAQSLAGWWYLVLVERLRSKDRLSISRELLQERLTDLASQYVVSTLPLFADIAKPDAEETARLLPRLFVRQLIAIGHAPDKMMIAGALSDFYRADGHIKRWLESLRLEPKELLDFRDQLYGHWAANFGAIEPDADACTGKDDEQSQLERLGRSALIGSLSGCRAKLKDVELDYLRRGVLHLMANEPVIGWHPHWAARFGQAE